MRYEIIVACCRESLCAMFLSALLLLSNYAAAQDYRPVTSLLEIRKQNVTTQEWDLSCGAAALARATVTAASATRVLPAEVGAATMTDSPAAMTENAFCWNSSGRKGSRATKSSMARMAVVTSSARTGRARW